MTFRDSIPRAMRSLAALPLLLCVLAASGRATTFTSAQNGAWNSATTWIGGVNTPGAGDDVVISHQVSLTQDQACNNLTVSNLSLRLTGAFTVSVNGTLNTASTLTNEMFISGPKIKFVGPVPRALFGSNWASIGSNLIIEVALDPGNVCTYTGNLKAKRWMINSGTFVVTGELRPDSTVSSSGILCIGNAGVLEITGALVRNASPNQAFNYFEILGNGILRTASLAANVWPSGTPASLSPGSTVEYTAAGNQNVHLANYGNLVLSGSGTKTAAGLLVVNGTASAIRNLVTMNVSTFTLGVNSGATLTVDAGGTLVTSSLVSNNGTLRVNGTYQMNQGGDGSGSAFVYGAGGSLVFAHTSTKTVIGTPPYWPATNGPTNVNVAGPINTDLTRTVSGTVQFSSYFYYNNGALLTVSGTCQINPGADVQPALNYTNTSTLLYATSGSFSPAGEWGGHAGTGVGLNPQNLILQSGTLNLPGFDMRVPGNVSITGGTLAMNATTGDLYVGGNWSHTAGLFTPNGRAVRFDGTGAQTIDPAVGMPFDILVNSKTTGTLQLASGVNVTGASGNTLQLLGSVPLDLNGKNLTISSGGLLVSGGARSITSTASASVSFLGTAGTVVSATSGGTLSLGSTVTAALGKSVDFGAGLTTINGTLRLDASGSVTTNAPTYAAGTLLKYNTGGTFSRGTEWSATSGAGYPQNVQLSANTTLNMGANSGAAVARQMAGNLIIDSGSKLSMNTTPMTQPVTVLGNVTIAGTLELSTLGGGDFNLKGNWSRTGTFTPNGRTVGFTGTGSQSVTGASTFSGLSVASGTGMTLSNDLTVTSLNLGANKIVTGANKVILPSTGSVSRTTGYVQGNLQKAVAVSGGVGNATFEVGDGTRYAPVDFHTANGIQNFNVTASTTAGAHPNLATSGLSTSNNVSRYWTVTGPAASGNYGSYDATFNFNNPADFTGSPNTSNLLIGKYNSPTWSFPIPGTRGASGTQATGLTSFSDFALAEAQGSTTALAASPSGSSVFGQNVALTATISPSVATGIVTFKANGVSLGSSSVSGGTAALNTTAIAVGAGHSLTAEYSGGGTYAGSTSPIVSYTVNKANTTTAVASGANPTTVGQSVTFTATVAAVAPGAGTQTGTVQFKVDGSNAGSPQALVAGVATYLTSSLPGGTHTVAAVYSGDGNFNTSTGNLSPDQVVNFISTSTALDVAPAGSSVFGQNVTLTATVSPAAASGTVTFKDGAATLGTGSLSGGTASLGTTALTVGSHSFTAEYGGDASYATSASSAASYTVNEAGTTTSVGSSANPSAVGQSVTFTATVAAAAPGAGTPTGTVQFKIDGSNAGVPQALTGGSAGYSTSSLLFGSHTVEADYSGDGNFTASVGNLSPNQVVTLVGSSTALSISPADSSVFGEQVTFTATVTPAVATGIVRFMDGAFEIGRGTLSGGTATYSTSALAVATYPTVAVYDGDALHAASSTTTTYHAVHKASTSTSVVADVNPSAVGQLVTFTATVSAVAPGAGTASGTVQFKVDGLDAGAPVALSGGSAAHATSALSAGAHTVAAEYSGDASFKVSSGTLSGGQAVNLVSTATSLDVTPASPTVFGQPVTLTATVSPAAATGTVTFKDGGSTLGTGSLSGGEATLETSALATGGRSLTAEYGGDATYAASASSSSSHTVNPAASTTSVVSDINPSSPGQLVTFTATVAAVAPGAGTPTGSVQFKVDGSNAGAPQTLSGGSAGYSTSSLTSGSHTVQADYSGDANFTASLGNLSPDQVVTLLGTSTALDITPADSSVFGEQVTFNATVTPGTATGTVRFMDGASEIGSGTLSGGTASFSTSALAVATYATTAVYDGDPQHETSSTTITNHTVNKASTSTGVMADVNPSALGQLVTFTTTVAAVAPGAGTASGTVQFKVDGLDAGAPVALSGGTAAYATSGLPAGAHTVAAEYSGDASFMVSIGMLAGGQVVNLISSATSLDVTPASPTVFGQEVTLTATVSPAAATGTVTFKDGASTLGTGAVSGGVATLEASALATGGHSLTAEYGGDATYAASASSSSSHTVNPASSTTSVAADVNPSSSGQLVTFTATVAAVAPGAGTPTGSVQFKIDGSNAGAPQTLSGGTASYGTSSLASGTHAVAAEYGGDAEFLASAGNLSPDQEVTAPAHTITATAGPHGSISPSGISPVNEGGSVAYTIAPDGGYGVDSVIVDGAFVGAVSGYTFNAVTADHTIYASFHDNVPPPPPSQLSAGQQRSGNGTSGLTRIAVSWDAVEVGATVKVYRASYGAYPTYSGGSAPTMPSYPPSAPWALTGLSASGQFDTPAQRGFYYYAAFVVDSLGNASSPVMLNGGALNYHLGDWSDHATPGSGDNAVDLADISLLGAHYSARLGVNDPLAYLDVGPTTNGSVLSRSVPDGKVNFEELILCAINFEHVGKPAWEATGAAGVATDELSLRADGGARVGDTVDVALAWRGTGKVQGVSVRLRWNAGVVRPVGAVGSAWLERLGGVAFSAEPGAVDVALLGARISGLAGVGELGRVRFVRVGVGEVGIQVESVMARSSSNSKVAVGVGSTATVIPGVSGLRTAVPNPFRGSTLVEYQLAEGGPVKLAIFAADGRMVRLLVSGTERAGTFQVRWDGKDARGRGVAAGTYYARLLTGRRVFGERLTLVR